jgi:hypothetical protein
MAEFRISCHIAPLRNGAQYIIFETLTAVARKVRPDLTRVWLLAAQRTAH